MSRTSLAVAFGATLLALYVASFLVVRKSSALDECGIVRVNLVAENIRLFYRPLVNIDKLLIPNVVYEGEVDEVRIANQYRCGE